MKLTGLTSGSRSCSSGPATLALTVSWTQSWRLPCLADPVPIVPNRPRKTHGTQPFVCGDSARLIWLHLLRFPMGVFLVCFHLEQLLLKTGPIPATRQRSRAFDAYEEGLYASCSSHLTSLGVLCARSRLARPANIASTKSLTQATPVAALAATVVLFVERVGARSSPPTMSWPTRPVTLEISTPARPGHLRALVPFAYCWSRPTCRVFGASPAVRLLAHESDQRHSNLFEQRATREPLVLLRPPLSASL